MKGLLVPSFIMIKENVDVSSLRVQADAVFTPEQETRGVWLHAPVGKSKINYEAVQGKRGRDSMRPSTFVQGCLSRCILEIFEHCREDPNTLPAFPTHGAQKASAFANFSELNICKHKHFDSNFSTLEKSTEKMKDVNILYDEKTDFFTTFID